MKFNDDGEYIAVSTSMGTISIYKHSQEYEFVKFIKLPDLKIIYRMESVFKNNHGIILQVNLISY